MNAYSGASTVSGGLGSKGKKWPLRTRPPERYRYLKPKSEPDPKNWRHASVGWGLIAPMTSGFVESDLRQNLDLPECLRFLLEKRDNAPVFRYDATWAQRFSHVHNLRDGTDISLANTQPGVAPGCLPKYLLIWGTPKEVPWEIQCNQHGARYIGRIPLKGEELNNYVNALMNDWAGCDCNMARPIVWAVDDGYPDITRLMCKVIAERVYQDLAGDEQIGANAVWMSGEGAATGERLIGFLADAAPALIVTTSHGKTSLNPENEFAAQLGLPVDQNHEALDMTSLLRRWQPNGAIWYAHACCSAGSLQKSLFLDLVDSGSAIANVLRALSRLGSEVAPLPQRLLGAKKPARAFIGHVEPTFNWTLMHPQTKQIFTRGIQKALYQELFSQSPAGYALRHVYENLSSIRATYETIEQSFEGREGERADMLYHNLVAQDLRTMVILGDPTVALPPLV